MKHPIIQDLQHRYTTKKYDKTRKIPAEQLDIIFEAMRLSPSSINSQPWKFIVIESDEAKQRMSETFINKFQFNQQHIFDSSHTILFAHNPRYSREDYAEVVDNAVEDQRTRPEDRDKAFTSFLFAELNTDETGNNSNWTKAQTYLAFGNTLHTLARLKIDATPMEGIDIELVNKAFEKELDGYQCEVALAMGYHHPEEDYNVQLPKSRRRLDSVLTRI
ncbi:MAG: nitroreductase family protein [Marinicella sp.]|nr:nitroreductase family protein [Xanthomonadales bacterium]